MIDNRPITGLETNRFFILLNQAVSDSLAMAREQIEREGQRHSGHHAWPGNTNL